MLEAFYFTDFQIQVLEKISRNMKDNEIKSTVSEAKYFLNLIQSHFESFNFPFADLGPRELDLLFYYMKELIKVLDFFH